MRHLINIVEDVEDVILYHGTLKDNIESISKTGLSAMVGDMVSHFYDDSDDLEDLVFAADRNSLQKCASAIGHQLWMRSGDRTYGYSKAGMRDHGAICIIEADVEDFEHADEQAINYGLAPSSAEPGDYYSRSDVRIDGIITGDDLISFLDQHGVRWND